jgi:hypothetical protein
MSKQRSADTSAQVANSRIDPANKALDVHWRGKPSNSSDERPWLEKPLCHENANEVTVLFAKRSEFARGEIMNFHAEAGLAAGIAIPNWNSALAPICRQLRCLGYWESVDIEAERSVKIGAFPD